jgi:hypothetical protein
MAAVDLVANILSVQVPVSATAGQVVKIIVFNADGSQSAILSELRVPAGKNLVGGMGLGGNLEDAV